MAFKHVKYHVWNESPVQVQCTIPYAWGWCTGMTQRDVVKREEGGGFRMGSTCIPVADSFWFLAKLIQCFRFKNKIKFKKKKEYSVFSSKGYIAFIFRSLIHCCLSFHCVLFFSWVWWAFLWPLLWTLLSSALLISLLLVFSSSFVLFFGLEHISLSSHFVWLSVLVLLN